MDNQDDKHGMEKFSEFEGGEGKAISDHSDTVNYKRAEASCDN